MFKMSNEEDEILDICYALNKFYIDNENLIEEDLTDKQKIIERFNKNIKNNKIDISNLNANHDGKEGHVLEKLMGIKHNADNLPDLYGYEMKKDSAKITFGDFSALEYAFSDNKKYINKENNWENIKMTRDEFIEVFGDKNTDKDDRPSWSGACIPKYNKYNNCGQIFKINENNDLCIYYSELEDKRKKNIPDYLKGSPKLIAIWTNDKLKNNINNKFNNKGFFICMKNKKTKLYEKIGFGKPFNFEFFIEKFKTNEIFFDSGMHKGNNRNYSQFRANNNFWHKLIIEEY